MTLVLFPNWVSPVLATTRGFVTWLHSAQWECRVGRGGARVRLQDVGVDICHDHIGSSLVVVLCSKLS